MTSATKLDWRFTKPGNTPLVSLEQMLDVTGLDELELQTYLTSHNDFPVATYKGEDLWLVETLHDLLVDRQTAHVLANRRAADLAGQSTPA